MEFNPAIDVTGPHQTRPPGWPADLDPFAEQLEAVLKTGRHELASLVAGLNENGSLAPDGQAWTSTSLTARLAELNS